MNKAIPHLFADATAKLEDLHAVAIEGQRANNAPDMQNVLTAHLRDGLVALDGTIRAIGMALEGGAR
ncbi:MAG: hypothetical protein B7Y43_18355 [Sphingomonas sp. 28-62-20]|uniref:hypothetical protein n=1 Tax=Sphingomonas sp. 28-62-20 TaxID=1970433 RepID=UPI000BCC195E|nr:MAG: hypothetical protein B7Y43_18355 [Sphingomonas sp. 28-62-20]